jgi:hypothetical protein
MQEAKRLITRFLFSSVPADWALCTVSVDWNGEPLLLFQEGSPPRPTREAGIDAFVQWANTPPKRHHLIYWDGTANARVAFENPQGLLTTSSMQRFGDGWLIVEGRGGLARIFDKHQNVIRTIDLGDAIKHVSTTADGQIWVGYFDEGVFGGGIGQEGLVCFDSAGTPTFRYAEFARKHELPFIDDCYSLNVVGASVYVSYYSAFPLVWLTNFQLQRVWRDIGANKAIAIRSDQLVIFPAYHKPYLLVRSFDSSDTTVWNLITSEGRDLSALAGGPPDTTLTGWYVPFQCVARNNRLYVYDQLGLYELP